MSIPPSFLEDIKARIQLSDLIGRSVRLKKAGREYSGLCPFHKEKSPSFTVNNEKGFFHCFGCGAHGDHIGYLTDHDGLAFVDAVETLASMAGMEVPRSAPVDRERERRRKTLYDLMDEVCRYYQTCLKGRDGEAARSYTSARGLDEGALGQFRIGYAPASGDRLISHCAQIGFDVAAMEEAGLVRTPDDGRRPYAFFRDRLMFPVTDKRGRVVAFGGRTLGENGPKYINSPDGPIFHKGRLLYNLASASPAVQRGHGLIVVEGYMDVIALVRAGFQGAVAPLGTAVTPEQIEELWRVSTTPVLCFDGDGAGRRAAIRAVERALPNLRPDHSIRIAFLPTGEDPDTLVRNGGPDAMRTILTGALPLSEIIWREECARHDMTSPEGLAGLKAGLDDRARQIADETVRRFYQQFFRDRLNDALPGSHRFGSPGRNGQGRTGAARSGQRGMAGQWRGRGGAPGGDRGGRGGFMGAAGTRDIGRYVAEPSLPPTRVAAVGSLMPLILLALMIHHPRAFDEFGEMLGLLRIDDARLDKLRQDVIAKLSFADDVDENLDSETARGHLLDSLDGDALKKLDVSGVYDHAPYVSAETSDLSAIEGWRETWRLHGLRQVRLEMRRALTALGSDPTDESQRRLAALKALVAGGGGGHGLDVPGDVP